MVVRRALFAGLAVVTLMTLAGMAWPVPPASRREPVPAGAFAFVARLNALAGTQRETCTASLVGRWWAVTAAHCVRGVERLALTLTFDADRAVVRGVDSTFVDPAGQDIALLELDAPVNTIEPVALAAPGDGALWHSGEPVTAVGWGGTVTRSQPRWTSQLVRDRSTSLDHGKIGTAPDARGGWAIQGDSGGPLLARDPATHRYVEVGVFSMLNGGGCFARLCLPVVANRWGKVGKPSVHRWLTSTITSENAGRPLSRPVHSHPRGHSSHPPAPGAAKSDP